MDIDKDRQLKRQQYFLQKGQSSKQGKKGEVLDLRTLNNPKVPQEANLQQGHLVLSVVKLMRVSVCLVWVFVIGVERNGICPNLAQKKQTKYQDVSSR